MKNNFIGFLTFIKIIFTAFTELLYSINIIKMVI